MKYDNAIAADVDDVRESHFVEVIENEVIVFETGSFWILETNDVCSTHTARYLPFNFKEAN